MKKKKIWIPIVSLVLVAALGTGLALYFTRKPGKTVGVYDSNQLTMTYWGDEKTSSGPVTTDKLQTVFLSATQEVTKAQVRAARFSLGGEVLRRREVRGLRLNQRRFAARLTVFGVRAFQS